MFHNIGLRFTISGRSDGRLILPGFSNQVPARLRSFLTRSFPDVKIQSVVGLDQVHGTTIRIVRRETPFLMYRKTDGVMTQQRNVVLTLKSADCVPVILYDPVHHVLACVHSGWRGTLQGIVSKALRKMRSEFGSRAKDVRIFFGPSIRACCYECSPQRLRAFRTVFGPDIVKTSCNGRPSLDLIAANRIGLARAGVSPKHVRVDPDCTSCSGRKKYFSYRRGDRHVITTAAVME